ncbi:hypothetical protein DACRYDRAFT_23650 [Dacryopinax primogenitus]|uniref:Uncharacterized protein n=1 Tax=Dacryopinax primogenitus (strain DJM 731) TaxID=1858805 RepID=M5G132_DACPD|nr:uncharacterized protein DACRYDRAFT_23650 [Dacryopinax primogenitus]EJT99531.1 hypothetical protein DACRYDRAFT_23650 [Dacryopinax primogenitus]
MAAPLNLHFQNQKTKKNIYHREGRKGAQTKVFDLDSILGNDNGSARWGWRGISLSADEMKLEGHILKARLATLGATTWVPVEVDLSKHLKAVGDKLEAYALPIIPQEELAALEKQAKDLEEGISAQKKQREEIAKEADTREKLAEEMKKQQGEKDKAFAAEIAADVVHDAEELRKDMEAEQRHAEAEAALKREAVEKEALYLAEEAVLESRNAQILRAAELEVSGFVSQAETSEARELQTAHDRMKIEEQLSLAQKKLAEEAAVIAARELNMSKTFGDHAWLNSEIKERDLKMAYMFREKTELYRELSQSHERFTTLDMQRLTMSEEHNRIRSVYATLMDTYKKTTMKLTRVQAECRKQKAELEHVHEEKSRFQSKCTTLEAEIDELRAENIALKTLTTTLKAERSSIRAKFEKAQTTLTGQESVIKHSEMWKVLFEQQVQTLRKELSDVTSVMTRLEQSYQDTRIAFRAVSSQKEKLQSELVAVKYSKTSVEARVVVVEEALQAARFELSQLSRSFEEKEDELRAMAGVKAVLERRLSGLSMSHSQERHVSRSISERLAHVQGSMVESVDWMYDMRNELGEESKYVYLHYLQNGGSVGLGLQSPPLARLPSYRSALNSPEGSPERAAVPPLKEVIEYSTQAGEVKVGDVKAVRIAELEETKIKEVPVVAV